MEQRDGTIDAAKGIGILFVFFGHLVPYDSYWFRVVFNFHMPLFFFLSGMLFNPGRDANVRSLLLRIWRTIALPAVFFTILGTLICIATGRFMRDNPMDWIRVAASFLHGSPVYGGSIWFLTCLADVHILFWFWCRWRRNRYDRIWEIAFLSVLFVAGAIFGQHIHPKILLGGPLMLFSIPMALFFYALGFHLRGYVYWTLNFIGRRWSLAVAALLAILEIGLARSATTPNLAIPEFPSPLTFLPAACCGTGCVLCIASSCLSNGILRFIGRFSLYYFMLERWSHEAWSSICRYFLPNLLPTSGTEDTILTNLTPLQTCVFFLFVLVAETLALPVVRKALEWHKQHFTAQ